MAHPNRVFYLCDRYSSPFHIKKGFHLFKILRPYTPNKTQIDTHLQTSPHIAILRIDRTKKSFKHLHTQSKMWKKKLPSIKLANIAIVATLGQQHLAFKALHIRKTPARKTNKNKNKINAQYCQNTKKKKNTTKKKKKYTTTTNAR